MEASAVSRSETILTTTENSEHKIFQSLLFPLYDNLTEFISIPSIFYYFSVFYCALQCLLTPIWLPFSKVWLNSEASYNFAKYYQSIFTLMPPCEEDLVKLNSTDLMIVVVAYSVIAVITAIFLFAQLGYYSKMRRFIKWTLYPTRFFLEVVPSWMLHPCAAVCGKSFVALIDDHDNPVNYVYFILTLIYYFFFFAVFFISTKLITESAYLPISPLAAFNGSPFISLLMGSSVFLLLENLLSVFSQWIAYFLIPLHLLIGVPLLLNFLQRVFLKEFVCITFFTSISVCLLFDIINFVCLFISSANGTIVFAVHIIFFVIGIIVSTVIFYIQKRWLNNIFQNTLAKISEALDENNNEPITQINMTTDANEEKVINIIESLSIVKSEKNSIMFLQFALSEYYYQFIDIKIVRYFCRIYETSKMLMNSIKILSFFPSMTSYINYLYPILAQRRDLSMYDRFFLYQIQRLKIQRTSASSSVCVENLKNLTQLRIEIESNIANFWDQSTYSVKNLPKLTAKIRKLNSLYEEALAEFTNSTQHFSDFEHFLIECRCNYTSAIATHYKKGLVESGSTLKIDHAFKSLVQNYPKYLKNNIVNLRGQFLSKKKSYGTDSNNGSKENSANISFTSGSSINLDVAVEENIGKQMFNHARTRIAMQKALENKKPKAHAAMLLIGIFIFIATAFVIIFVYCQYQTTLDDRDNIRTRVDNIAKMRFYVITSSAAIILKHCLDYGAVTLREDLVDTDLPYEPFISRLSDLLQLSLNCSVLARENYKAFTESVVEYGTKRSDVRDFATALFNSTSKITICNASGFVEYHSYDIGITFSYLNFAQATLMKVTDVNSLLSDRSFCVTINTSGTIYEPFDELIETMQTSSEKEADELNKIVEIIRIVLPVAYFVIISPMSLIIFVVYFKEIQKVINMVVELPSKVKKEAKEKIYKMTNEVTTSSDDSADTSLFWVLEIFIILLFLVIAVLIFVMLEEVVETSYLFSYNAIWSFNSQIRKTYVVESLFWLYTSIIFQYDNLSYIRIDRTIELCNNALNGFTSATAELMTDNDNAPTIVNRYDYVDSVLLNSPCQQTGEDLHETYRCASSEQILSLYKSHVGDVIHNINTYNGTFSGEFSPQSFHMVFNHIIPIMFSIDEVFQRIASDNLNNIHSVFNICLPVLLIIDIIVAILFFSLLNKLYNLFQTLTIFILRINPQHVLASADLVKYLFNKTNDNSSVMTLHHRIMYNSNDGILSIDRDYIIELINPAISNIFGFSPDQLLGQTFDVMLSESSKASIEAQLKLMIHKQSAMTYEDHIECVTDTDQIINCMITIMAMTDNKGDINSFVIILTDESALQKHQKEAEEAKKASENLLYQILPRDIVRRLNQGDKDISFSVPSSTIMFVDIVKFSEYAASLTPQEIMANLSTVFAMFDTTITKYDELIKIKLIGDVYMTAGGLFNENVQPQVHAEQMVRFGLDCLNLIDEANIKLNSSLQVRIGVNTGGPLIAGVLGSDKPTFDIIGDPINIASRLQSTDVPGRIQISKAVFDLINELDFTIEQRGEIMLKGKGKTMTYLVSSFKVPTGFTEESSGLDIIAGLTMPTD